MKGLEFGASTLKVAAVALSKSRLHGKITVVMTGSPRIHPLVTHEAIINERKQDATDNVNELASRLVACDNFVTALAALGYTKNR